MFFLFFFFKMENYLVAIVAWATKLSCTAIVA